MKPSTDPDAKPNRQTLESHLFLQQDAAERELARIARESIAAALEKHGDPLGRVLDVLQMQQGVLTLDRVADLLGVSRRTITENYVPKLGLPAHRTGRTSPPLFLLREVEEWVGSLSSDAEEERGPNVLPISNWKDEPDEWESSSPDAPRPVADAGCE